MNFFVQTVAERTKRGTRSTVQENSKFCFLWMVVAMVMVVWCGIGALLFSDSQPSSEQAILIFLF